MFNMNLNISAMFGGMSGIGSSYGNYGGGFGYGNMSSMMNNMLGGYGMSGMMGMGGYGSSMMGGMMGGLGGMLGISGNMSLPIYGTAMGQAWDTTLDTSLGKRDPVYLDTNYDGELNVEKLDKAINFDMNGDGISDQVKEWNTQDAQLVYDANGDGQINSGREMMNEVGVNGEQGKYENGWQKAQDLFDTNKDGILSAKELEKASFWTDANGNGKVDDGEMKSAAESGIFGIDTENGSFLQQQQIGNMNIGFNMGMGMGMFGGMSGMMGMGNMGGYNMLGGMNGIGSGYGNYGGGYGNYGGGYGNYGGGYGNYGGGYGNYGGGNDQMQMMMMMMMMQMQMQQQQQMQSLIPMSSGYGF